MLTKEETSLIKIQFFTSFALSLGGIFLQIFIFRLSGLKSVVFFNLILFITLIFTYLFSGWTFARYSSRASIQAGLMLSMLGWLTLLLIHQQSISHLFLLGILFGIANGFYWSGYNLSQYILTHEEHRGHYFSRNGGFINAALTSGPIVGGLLITIINTFSHSVLTGYYVLFFVVSGIYVYNIMLTHTLPHYSGVVFSFKDILLHKRSLKWKLLLSQQAVVGFYDAAFNTVSGILLFTILGNELRLGFTSGTIGLLSTTTSFYTYRIIKNYSSSYIVGAAMATVGFVLFAVFSNFVGVIGLGFSIGIGLAFLNVSTSVAILNMFDENGIEWRHNYHRLIERDVVLGAARVLSYILLFFFFIPNQNVNIARIWILLIAPFPLLAGLLLYKIQQSTINLN